MKNYKIIIKKETPKFGKGTVSIYEFDTPLTLPEIINSFANDFIDDAILEIKIKKLNTPSQPTN